MSLRREERNLYRIIKKQFNSIYDVFESKTFLTSMYLLKYFESENIKYYNMFLENMNELSVDEKRQVLINVTFNLKEQQKNKNKDNKHNKVKTKNYNE